MATKERKELSKRRAHERVQKICADVLKKKRTITWEDLKSILTRHKFSPGAVGALHIHVKTTPSISLTKRGVDAAKEKFKERKR